jgi:glycosyltransferase involved in cell wall biosynthesis
VSPSRRKRPRVVAVVAARNEEASVARTVKALLEIPGVDEVLVAVDGTMDRTADEAAGAGARVLVGRRHVGKGGAVEAVVERAAPADVYLLVDADVADTASEAEVLLREVLEERLDLAIGKLPDQPGGGFGLVKGFARWWIRSLTGFDPAEPLSGQRAVRRDVLDGCRPFAPRFGLETAMTIDVVRLGYRVGEVPVEMTHRATGRDPAGFLHRARQGLDIVAAVLPRALRLR